MIDPNLIGERVYYAVIASKFNRHEYTHRIMQILIGFQQLGMIKGLETLHRTAAGHDPSGYEFTEFVFRTIPEDDEFYVAVSRDHPFVKPKKSKWHFDMDNWVFRLEIAPNIHDGGDIQKIEVGKKYHPYKPIEILGGDLDDDEC